jgi:hypothetical protein
MRWLVLGLVVVFSGLFTASAEAGPVGKILRWKANHIKQMVARLRR